MSQGGIGGLGGGIRKGINRGGRPIQGPAAPSDLFKPRPLFQPPLVQV